MSGILRSCGLVVLLCCVEAIAQVDDKGSNTRVFRAGAAAVDITPTNFPVIVNGNFNEVLADRAQDRLMSRALVLDDGQVKLAIVVVDSLMIPRELLDVAKQLAQESTGIPTERMLVSATHTHSAPSAMGCLGSRADADYQPFLVEQIAKSIHRAASQLTEAKVGWTVVQDKQHNHCRRWIYRPDRVSTDPFGDRNVFAHMHPGHQSPNHISEAGPADYGLSLLAVQSKDGQPMAVLANYAMHYYGAAPVSADFCGRFGDRLHDLIGATAESSPFVGMMSQGTSGDSMWMDYAAPAAKRDLEEYTLAVARVAHQAYRKIEYQPWVSLAMAEARLNVRRRVPDEQRLAWAKSVLSEIGDRLPKSRPEIYAREAIYLHETPEVELKLQAIRIGELGITAIPNEVYGITGLKLKAQSPLPTTFNIELANGAEGYIPPPEQHTLGGYTTWPARTAGLEVQAEPQIVETLLSLLEKVADKPRRQHAPPDTDYATAVHASKPVSYWRFQNFSGPRAVDSMQRHHGVYEDQVAFYLPGVPTDSSTGDSIPARAAHFAGGRMHATIPELTDTYAVELWFWNGFPNDARAVTGYVFSRGPSGSKDALGDHLGIGGTYETSANAGKLIFYNGNQKNELLVGSTQLQPKTWNHVVLVRDGAKVTVYLNGNTTPEFTGNITVTRPPHTHEVFVGGRNDGYAPFAGKISDVAVFDRALTPDEIAAHVQSQRLAALPSTDTVSSPKHASTAPQQISPDPEDPPLSPAESMAATLVREGYDIELVAAEPLVKDPVAIAWGTDGRLWVAEMADYPLGMDGAGQPGGRIRFLDDTNNDGRYDRSTLFLDSLRFPTGLMPWRNGVLITAAPDILFAEDTDGDGKADRREVLYSGFQEGNQQLRVNGLRWGLDNWIYCASGAHHGGYGADRRLRAVRTGKETELGSRDFRFHPDTLELDPQSGPSQFGRNRDDWGNWFGQQNSHPLWHFVLQDHYLRRNPHFAPPEPRRQLVGPSNPRVYPAKSPQKRFHSFDQSGRFTSACSAMIYRDDLLFPRTNTVQHAFTCEPFHNLVQHNVIVEDGVSFTSHRDLAESTTDFFASKDRWCRPVMARTGPDGALWIVDMYRYMIEHPQWLTPEGREELKPFYRSGDDRGRIYRVFPSGRKPRPILNLAQWKTPDLVAALDSPNGPQRDLVSQLLQWQADSAAIPPLQHSATQSPNPLCRLHALTTLEGLGQLSSTLVSQALQDQHPGIRRHAIRMAESLAANNPDLVATAVALVDDPDARVRLQLACSLGQWTGNNTASALARLAMNDAADPWLVAAVTSSIHPRNVADVLTYALTQQQNPQARSLIARLLALSVAFETRPTTLQGLIAIVNADQTQHLRWQYDTVSGLMDELQRKGLTIDELTRGADDPGPQARHRVADLVDSARDSVGRPDAHEDLRTAAVSLLARDTDTRSDDIQQLAGLLVPQTSPSLQTAIVRHLGTLPDAVVSQVLLDGWPGHGPGVRTEILRVLATRREWLTELLDAIESDHVSRADIDAATRQALSVYKDKAIQNRILKLLADAGSADRRQIVNDHQPVLQLEGDPVRGKDVFRRQCAACHKLDDVGHDIGPNLRSLTDLKPSSLLTSMLDPSAAVDGKFVTYIAVTDDGRTFAGMIASETANSLTLVEQKKKQRVILRTELEEIRSTGKSLMPEGLEKTMTHQDFADVISYVRTKDRN